MRKKVSVKLLRKDLEINGWSSNAVDYIVTAVDCHELAMGLAHAVIRASTEGSLKAHMPLNMAEDLVRQGEASNV